MEEICDITWKLFLSLFIVLSYILLFIMAKAAKQAVTDIKAREGQDLRCKCAAQSPDVQTTAVMTSKPSGTTKLQKENTLKTP